MRLKTVSSLEKCFLDESILDKQEFSSASCFKGEIFRFMLCFDEEETLWNNLAYTLKVVSVLGNRVKVSRIEHVGVQMPVYPKNFDDNYLRTTPGLFPDVLIPLNENCRIISSNTLQSLFVEVNVEKDIKAGTYPIEFQFSDMEGELKASATFSLEVIDAVLPEQELINTQWFYCDCLQNYYGTKAFDERHWEIIENYLKVAVKNGQNMLLTPIFTPALDTYVGGERPTTQLVGVTVENGQYRFDFSKLSRWVDLCDRVGIKYFEITHFFTQWGAKHAPKIMATVNGEERKIFGWETEAASSDYRAFLQAFIPEFIAFMKSKNGADKRCFFHISDEPDENHFEQYKASRDLVENLLDGYPIMDALSHYKYYEQGIVKLPVVVNDAIEPFLENGVQNLWTYYCCVQGVKVSNRFIAMPSARNRIIGTQMYKYDIKGFLHWGFNFYNNQFSYNEINPFLCTCGQYFAPAGDTFSVYPANDGTAYESLRLAVFHDAIQDMRAMKLCESYYGKDYVVNLIEDGIDPITFKEYPKDIEWLVKTREKINNAVKATL